MKHLPGDSFSTELLGKDEKLLPPTTSVPQDPKSLLYHQGYLYF